MKIRTIVLTVAPMLALASALQGQAAGSALATLIDGQKPGEPYIEQMTWTEIRDAMAAGKTTVIVPVGGTEKNGPHMVMGKHNYVITHAAGELAKRLGNALVAPTVAWVPEGNFETSQNFTPGVISLMAPHYQTLLEAAARSLQSHGFTEVLYIGDSGGDQDGMQEVADKLNAEWSGGKTKVYALTEYYENGQNYTRVWLQALYGYDMATIGSHAGITDTSAVMFVFPKGVRNDLRLPLGGSPDQGVSGDPSKASPEIGRMVINFKVVAAMAHYQRLTAPPNAGRGGRGGGN